MLQSLCSRASAGLRCCLFWTAWWRRSAAAHLARERRGSSSPSAAAGMQGTLKVHLCSPKVIQSKCEQYHKSSNLQAPHVRMAEGSYLALPR